ncbi:hypothetical protein BH20ACI4_BH20ACI4_10590 [soil metagenome]
MNIYLKLNQENMKGKKEFTNSEFEEIKKLISEKVATAPNKQNGIRNKIRKIGFYYSCFETKRKKGGYTVEDFENLRKVKKIKVIEDEKQ